MLRSPWNGLFRSSRPASATSVVRQLALLVQFEQPDACRAACRRATSSASCCRRAKSLVFGHEPLQRVERLRRVVLRLAGDHALPVRRCGGHAAASSVGFTVVATIAAEDIDRRRPS